jgi:excisionase family DNA binding protein
MKEACAALGLKEHKLRELIAAGKLAKMPDTGRRVLILPQEVRRFLRSCAA